MLSFVNQDAATEGTNLTGWASPGYRQERVSPSYRQERVSLGYRQVCRRERRRLADPREGVSPG
jgi:hypothetical protein